MKTTTKGVKGKAKTYYRWEMRRKFLMHCTENPIYVFPDMKLCGLVPNSYIHISVSDLYIPRIGLPIWLPQNRQTDPRNILIAYRYNNVEIGRKNIIILVWK
jgi:hypothetical protein